MQPTIKSTLLALFLAPALSAAPVQDCSVLLPGFDVATDLFVDGAQPTAPPVYQTIQEAVDAASPGQRIWVAPFDPVTHPGMAYGGFSFDKNIVVAKLPTQPQAPNPVVIRPSGAAPQDTPGIYNVAGSAIDSTTILDGLTIAGFRHLDPGSAFGQTGGGLLLTGTEAIVQNCVFEDNAAAVGGGVYVDGGAPCLVNCRFEANFTDNSATGSGYAGGLFVDTAAATVSHCAFIENGASRGGGLYVEGETMGGAAPAVTVFACAFLANGTLGGLPTPFDGGGAACEFAAEVRFEQCRFEDNVSADRGGGLWCDSVELQLDYGYFARNVAAALGGGLFLLRSPGSAMRNSQFVENAALFGGGIKIESDTFGATENLLSNCLLSQNRAVAGFDSGFGGGLYLGPEGEYALNNGVGLAISYCTFDGNLADGAGGGIYSFNQDLTPQLRLVNSILSGNAVQSVFSPPPPVSEQQVDGLVGTLVDSGSNYWQGHSALSLYPCAGCISSGGPGYDPNGDDAAPVVSQPDTGFFLDQSTSVCLNAGNAGAGEPVSGSTSATPGLDPDVGAPDLGFHYAGAPEPPIASRLSASSTTLSATMPQPIVFDLRTRRLDPNDPASALIDRYFVLSMSGSGFAPGGTFAPFGSGFVALEYDTLASIVFSQGLCRPQYSPCDIFVLDANDDGEEQITLTLDASQLSFITTQLQTTELWNAFFVVDVDFNFAPAEVRFFGASNAVKIDVQ
ncbi:MAG: hypothetical protein AAF682_26515 [Planctomycetota bacterium]